MNNSHHDPDSPGGSPGHPAGAGLAGHAGTSLARSRSLTRRAVTSAAAAAVLLGSGIGIGIALTGGASAAPAPAAKSATTHDGATSQAVTDASGAVAAGTCARIERALRRAGYPVAARRAASLCRNPLLRLAAVGDLHGEVTFHAKDGTKTLAFERGTVQSASGSLLVVRASDGTTMSWAVGAGTVVREDGRKLAAARIKAGDVVFVGGQVVSGANDARLVRIAKAG